jgi:hypothetical protein
MVYEEVGQPLDAYFAYREFLGRDRENNPYTHKFAEERIKEITKIDYSKFGN